MAKNSARHLATNRRNQWQKLLQNSAAPTATGNSKSVAIVLDTNVWYSAILFGGKPEEVITLCLNSHEIAISPFIINELRTILKSDARAPYKWLNALEKHLKRVCTLVDVDVIPRIVRDPNDDPIVATAVKGQSSYVITGDEDLLSLASIGKLRFVSAYQFLELVQKNTIKFGTSAGKFRYADDILTETDKDIQEMFYGKDNDLL